MTRIEPKFGFPLFTKLASTVYLGDHKKLVISDVWAFWDYVIKKNGKNKPFMNSLLEQAKNFYIAAENSPIKSKPLLFYYSFLNLSKIVIGLEKGYGPSNIYHHGLKESHNNKFSHSEITIHNKKVTLKNVAIELMEVLEPPPVTGITVKVKELLAHCVGIHRSYSEIFNQKEIFFKLYDEGVYKYGRRMFFRAKIKCTPQEKLELEARGYNFVEENGDQFYECSITTASNNKTRKDYYDLSDKLRREGIWYFIGNDGYVLYLSSLNRHRYAPESIIYITMFYLGSITRYHPYMFDKIFSDKEQWLMSEFLTTQPKQFVYLTSAKTLGQYVLKAYSSF